MYKKGDIIKFIDRKFEVLSYDDNIKSYNLKDLKTGHINSTPSKCLCLNINDIIIENGIEYNIDCIYYSNNNLCLFLKCKYYYRNKWNITLYDPLIINLIREKTIKKILE